VTSKGLLILNFNGLLTPLIAATAVRDDDRALRAGTRRWPAAEISACIPQAPGASGGFCATDAAGVRSTNLRPRIRVSEQMFQNLHRVAMGCQQYGVNLPIERP
jgi:hypothetical protein